MQTKGIRPWIQEQMRKGRLHVTRDEIRAAFPEYSSNALKAALMRAEADSILAYGWQGFYLLLPPTYAKRKTLPPMLYIDALMGYLKKPYCVALLNAAETYGAAHQKPMSFTVMTTNPPPRKRQTGMTRIDFIAKREFNKGIPGEFVRKIKVQTGYVSVSTPEITALSLIQYHEASGGLSHILTVMEELMESCHFESLPISAIRYFPISCFQRLGYMLDAVLGEQKQADILLKYLSEQWGKRLQYVPLAVGVSTDCAERNSKWKIQINTQQESDFNDT